ncbi:MAG: Ldh family oxidoreductase [Alphaproteobacteria bacterium]|nr:Ldh family oxidoreductase [Alphaproteobacteria bacterium]
MSRIPRAELEAKVAAAFVAAGATKDAADSVARALVAAEIDGQKGHGLSRVPSYAAQARSGKVDGRARPRIERVRPGAIRIDAASGFAYPAIDLAVEELKRLAPAQGIALAAIAHSHHCGVLGHPVERLAEAGLVALAFGNSPEAIAPWGGNRAIFGTNPIAFACPRAGQAPLVIDLSLSKVARGKIMVAAEKGEAIPEGWAVDKDGRPTTDAKRALGGAMLPMGDAKGAQLVLMVEILAAALGASNFGFEASSFFDAQGAPPHVGQLLIAIDPAAPSGGRFAERLEALIAAIAAQPGARLPGQKRLAGRAQAKDGTVEVDAETLARIEALVGKA